MAEELSPQTFRKSPEAVISYNYYDIARNTGYVTFYPAVVSNGNYIAVTNNDLCSEISETSLNLESGGDYTTTFNLTFIKHQTINGDIFFNIPLVLQDPNSNGLTASIEIKIYKVVGEVETQIGTTTTSATLDYNSKPSYVRGSVGLKTNISNIIFSTGEILRVKIKLTTDCWISAMGHNPANTVAFGSYYGYLNAGHTQQSWLIPFKLQ